MSTRPHVVIVGAGFGGLWAAKELAGAPVDVTLIDRNNYHSFFPLLYQVAAAELEPGDIAYPVRAIIRKMSNVTFRLGTVTDVDLRRRTVDVAGEPLPYDRLILAPGSTTQYFGVTGAAEHAWPLRTLDEAIALRNHTLREVELSSRLSSPDREQALTFVVVGGGPTGVEYSGALAELVRGPLAREHRALAAADVRVIVVEGSSHLLNVYPDRLRAYAARRLERMGVEVRLDAAVASVDARGVELADGSRIDAATVVWTAGVGGPPDLSAWGLPVARNGTVSVTDTLCLEPHPEVAIVGDAARPQVEAAPMVAQNALQQGRLVARNILFELEGRPPEPYQYRDLGNMAVIGRNAAVVHLFNRFAFTGFVAWAMWLTVHLMKLVGFRNRVSALLSWAGDYLFADRAARLILPGD
jgi:NADH dehydrogenase